MASLRELIDGPELTVAPVALSPMMARMAKEAGFEAIYLSGGSLGWEKCVTEANLTLPDFTRLALEMRAVCDLPIVLDAGGGWGDPVHLHHTVGVCQAAGFAAIEIEDQVLPRRVHHHIGVEYLIPAEDMVPKIREACVARGDGEMLIVARTNAQRVQGIEEAVRRGEMYRAAGADMVFVHTRTPEEIRFVGERLGGPLMIFAPQDGFATFPMSKDDLAGLGYRLACSSGSAFAAMHKAIRQSYECLAEDRIDTFLGEGGAIAEMKRAHAITGLDRLLEIEERTMGTQSDGPAR